MTATTDTIADVDRAIAAAWASYQTRALQDDSSAGRVLEFIDTLLDRRTAIDHAEAT